MIGQRVTSQTSVSLCCCAGNRRNHKYFHKDMNSALLPQVKSMTNTLQRQALHARQTSGEILNCISVKILQLNNHCKLSVINQFSLKEIFAT